MLASFSIKTTFKNFLFFYFSAIALVILIMIILFNIYANYIFGVVKDLSRNPVMIHDSFSLRQSLVPLIKDDILEIQIIDLAGNIFFSHNQDSDTYFLYNQKYKVFEKETMLYEIHLKMNLRKYVLIFFAFTVFLLLGYYPFLKYDQREYQHRANQLLANLSKKLAHDIRTPISTLNLISSRISDENIKELQTAVVKQINQISENLLNANRSEKSSVINFEQSYASLLNQIRLEFDMKLNQSRQIIFFEIDKQLCNYPEMHSKILYPAICNIINNSFDALSTPNGRIDVYASLEIDQVKIIVRDNGKGIPTDILAKLGNTPLSYGKSNNSFSGSGIALFNARNDLASIKGSLKICSLLNQFTEVEITVPVRK